MLREHWLGCALSWLALVGGCGSRSELLGAELCSNEGAVRACRDACGPGTQTCEEGVWGACAVPVQTRGCSDACGRGAELCQRGAWQACEVPPQTVACSTVCGDGVRICQRGQLGACEVSEVTRRCSSVCGDGEEHCRDGAWGRCDAPQPKPPRLEATVRDFTTSHPDFEAPMVGKDPGIVEPTLGADDLPAYGAHATTLTTHGKAAFDQWFRDVPGVNLTARLDLQLRPDAEDPGLFVYESQSFFPIDDQLFGNEGRPHNYHFTLQAKASFDYRGGEIFSFTGDDDMWVFINRQLAIDLGGTHTSLDGRVGLDDVAQRFGMKVGGRYELHFFFAERHTVASSFTIRTSIAEVGSCE